MGLPPVVGVQDGALAAVWLVIPLFLSVAGSDVFVVGICMNPQATSLMVLGFCPTNYSLSALLNYVLCAASSYLGCGFAVSFCSWI